MAKATKLDEIQAEFSTMEKWLQILFRDPYFIIFAAFWHDCFMNFWFVCEDFWPQNLAIFNFEDIQILYSILNIP